MVLLEAARPRQWTKNVFVFAGVVFAGRLFEPAAVVRATLCFAAFCAAASCVYLVNDVFDREADRHHPRKRLRPVASGRLSVAGALGFAMALGAAALALTWTLPPGARVIVLTYLLLSFSYTAALKRVFLLDSFIVALGFVLRAAAGAASLPAEISPWLLVCTLLLALYLVLGKRRAEVELLGNDAGEHRSALSHYSVPLVDSWLTALSGATIVCYAIYTQAERTVEHFHTTGLVYTVPFVVYALFRYQGHVMMNRDGGDPGNLLWRSRSILVAIAGWALTAAWIIYR